MGKRFQQSSGFFSISQPMKIPRHPAKVLAIRTRGDEVSVPSELKAPLRAPLFRCESPRGATLLPLRSREARPLQLQSFDEPYVERLRSGDFRTQEHFVAYFSELIQLKLRSRLRSPQAIDDVRQETFTRVFAALHAGKIRQPDRLGAFVNSMCNNVLLEHYRSSSRDTSLDEDEERDFPDMGIDVLGALAAKRLGQKVREILDALPERDRRLLRGIFLEERDKDELCRDFGVDRDYLRVLLHRAKQVFKSQYLKSLGGRPPGVVAAENS